MKKLLSIALLGGALFLAGCGDSQEDFVFTNTQNVVAPVCVDDTYTVNSNTALTTTAANGVLANDTVNGALVAFPVASAQGGTVAGNADGSFTYTPAANFTGVDTFDYTLANTAGAVTCTVTITVNAVNGFFVDATNGNDGTGSFTNGLPFATIQAAITAAPAGSDIVVRPGNYTGTITLQNGDRLLGSGSVLAQGTPVRPTLTGPVVLGDGCTVDFVRIDGTAGDAVDGNGQNGGTVTNCELANTTGAGSSGVGAAGSSGNWTISSNTISNTGGFGIDVTTTGTANLTLVCNGNTITGSQGAIGLQSGNTSNLDCSVTGNIMTTSSGVGSAFEAFCTDTSTFCLDLENNTNDDVFRLSNNTVSTFNVEELADLTVAQPTGAGNTGTVSVDAGAGFSAPTSQLDGFCGF